MRAREWSEYLSCFGHPPGFVLDYALFVGLMLQAPRIRLRASIAAAEGQSVAGSNSPLSYEWADAMCAEEEQAEEVLTRINRERAVARTAAKWGI